MEPTVEAYGQHRIELRARSADRAPESGSPSEVELLIDDEPVRYGRLPDGQYFLDENAYDWGDDLTDLARRLIDYRERTGDVRRRRSAGAGD